MQCCSSSTTTTTTTTSSNSSNPGRAGGWHATARPSVVGCVAVGSCCVPALVWSRCWASRGTGRVGLPAVVDLCAAVGWINCDVGDGLERVRGPRGERDAQARLPGRLGMECFVSRLARCRVVSGGVWCAGCCCACAWPGEKIPPPWCWLSLQYHNQTKRPAKH